jgi:hypothetical protein
MLRNVELCRSFRIGALCAAVLVAALARPAYAQTQALRVPETGTPALTITVPTGWTVNHDRYGNLQLFAADRRTFLQLSIISDSHVATLPLSDIAVNIFKEAGAAPYTASATGAIAGVPGQIFSGSLTASNGVVLTMKVTLVKVDDSHVAALSALIGPKLTSQQQAALDDLISRVGFAGLK